MSRYSDIGKGTYFNPNTNNTVRGYLNVKYPSIPLDFSDVYVYTNRGDRYDLLSQNFYGDPNLWWIIARANPSQTPDSLIPEVGAQIRIPSKNRLSKIISSYNLLNNLTDLISLGENNNTTRGSSSY